MITQLAFTPNAIEKVKSWLGQSPEGMVLRIYIVGGGCSGFQYGFDLDSVSEADDLELVVNGVTIRIDPLSFQYLVGSEVDFVQDLKGARFVVNNPQAKSTCGCGASFSLNFEP